MATFRVRNAANNGWLDLADVQGFRVRNAANNGWLDINGGAAALRVRNAANNNWIEYTPVQEIASIETTSGFSTLLDISGNGQHQGGPGTGIRPYGLWLDGPLNVYRGGDGNTYVITGHSETYRFRVGNWTNGATWTNLTNVYNSPRNTAESAYANRDWIFGCHAIGNTVYGVAHHEWYRNTQTSNGIGGYPNNSPELAQKQHVRAIKWLKSTNNGASWAIKSAANSGRVIMIPEPWSVQSRDTIYGWLHPSNIVKEGSHYYCFVEARNLPGGTDLLDTGVVLIRTTNLENTTGWQFWNGSGWTTRNNGYQGGVGNQTPYIFFKNTGWNPYTTTDRRNRVAQCIRYHVPTQQWLIFGHRGTASPFFCYARSKTLANPQFETNDLQGVVLSGGGSGSDYIGNSYINVFDPNDTDQNFQNILGDTALVVTVQDQVRYRRQTIKINLTGSAPIPNPEPEEPIVILATGQSNMFIDRSMSWSPNSRVKLWNNSRASDTSAGSAFSSLSSSQMNVAASYAHQVALANPNREVRLINISAGSLGIASWIGGAKYDITAQTAAPPANANVRFNNSTQASATLMFIHKTDKQGSGRHSHYIRVASGTRIYVRNASGVLRTYAATGNPTDNGTYITVPIAFQSGSTANFSGTLDVLVQPDFRQAMSSVVPAALASAGKSTVDVFLWWQGESDAAYNSEVGYKADWNKMKTWLNGRSWFPSNTKTLIFSPVSTAISINGAAYWDQMRTWLQDIRNADSANRYWINLPGSLNSSYWTDSNNVHMTAEGYRQAGILAADAYMPS